MTLVPQEVLENIIRSHIIILQANQQVIEVETRGHFRYTIIQSLEEQISNVVQEQDLILTPGVNDGLEAKGKVKTSFSQ
jgi:hypothetical protein